jgi:nucleoside phosphorylase
MKYQIFIPSVKEAKHLFGGNIREEGGFLFAKYRNHDVLISGVGKCNTALNVTRRLFLNPPEEDTTLILIGIAGAYPQGGLKIGDVRMIRWEFFADEALLGDGALTGVDEIGFPVCPGNKIKLHTPDWGFEICDANTVSLIPATPFLSDLYHKKTGALLEAMEGAAFGLAAAPFNLKAVQIRSISNFTGAADEWDIKKGISALKEALASLPI